MAMRRVFALLFLLVFTAANGPEQPTSSWRIDYGETQCVAMRLYGERTLAIRPSPRGESYEILLIKPGATVRGALQSDGAVTFGQEPIRSTMLVYSDAQSHSKIYKFRLTAADFQHARSSDRIVLQAKYIDISQRRQIGTRIVERVGGDDAELALSQMSDVMDGLDKCTADLRKYWNDGGDVAAGRTSPKGDVRPIFSSDDYPAIALLKNQGGATAAILMIDEKGDVAGCYNSLPSGIASLDAISCQIMIERAKFSPARDPQGKPVKSMYQTPKIVFMIADAPAPPVTPR